jgi:hypothetical protein
MGLLCSAESLTPIPWIINGPTAIVFAVILASLLGLWRRAARRQDRQRHGSRYEFDARGRAHRVPAEDEDSAG